MDAITRAVHEAAADMGDTPGIGRDTARSYAPRVEWELRQITARKGTAISLWDLGGGLGLLAHAAAQLSIKAANVDDYVVDLAAPDAAIDRLERAGVRVIRHDFSELLTIDPGVDVVTTMHTIEHMHSSPKEQYHRVVDALAPGGLFVIACPNAVNLRKRVTTLMGKSSWSTMGQWYESPVFRSHVREPVLDDLRYIAQDLGLSAEFYGKNFIGQSRGGWRGRVAGVVGPMLERRPTLCSDLYLIGTK